MSIALPFELLTLLDDGMYFGCADVAEQRFDLIGLRDKLLIFVVLFRTLTVYLIQLFYLLDQLSLMLELGLPFVQVEFFEQLEELHVKVVIAFIPPC
jgi:hypothetical protein